MKLNTEKYHLLISRDKCKKGVKDIGEDRIWETSNIKLIGKVNDNKLKFHRHISKLCSNANNKRFDKNDIQTFNKEEHWRQFSKIKDFT